MKNILVFSPHPDDEVLGCGGYLALMRSAGSRIHVVVVTDGAKGTLPGQPAAMRKDECRAGLEALGVTDVTFCDYPDGHVPLSGRIVEDCRGFVGDLRPEEILLPAPAEPHPDHRRITRLILKALAGLWQGRLLFYETVHPSVLLNQAVDITSVFNTKLCALKAHESQLKQFNYEENCRSLARLRGIPIGKEFAEGFLSFHWDGTPQNFFETRPLISVIVRTKDQSLLKHALESLIRQEYDQIETILVWFGDEEPDLGPFHYLDIRLVKGAPNRSRNLNLGISKARGEYIAFLDEDDVLLPNHFAALLPEIHGMPGTDMVYSGARLVACVRLNGEVRIDRQIKVMNEPVPAGHLLVGNSIPIHSALYRAGLFRNHEFLEELEAYEDWELLARLYMEGHHFRHVDEVTCEYRLFDFKGSGANVFLELHQEKGYTPWREKVLSKLRERLKVQHLEHLASIVDGHELKIAELNGKLSELSGRNQILEARTHDYASLEKLLKEGLSAMGEEKAGRQGLAAWIGRSLPPETLFSIVLPVHNTPPDLLSQTLLSVASQAYPGWELCLVDDASGNEQTKQMLSALPEAPEFRGRLHCSTRVEQGGIVAASMDAIKLGKAPYLVFLDHDDLLHEEALLSLALALKREKHYALLYTDSRKIDLAGEPIHIYRKQDWAPETLAHLNYINHLTVIRRDALEKIGGLCADYDGAQDWDALLRLSRILTPGEIRHIPEVLYDWRAAENSLAYRKSSKPLAFEAAKRAVKAHLTELGFREPEVEPNPIGPGVRCRWRADLMPLEVIIPTHNNAAGLKMCVEGLLNGTDYPDLSITVVVNRTTSAEMREYVDGLAANRRARVLANDKPFNWSMLNNQAARETSAPLLLFMNDDVEIRERRWLSDLCRYLQFGGVGAIGATLLYPHGGIQHNGIKTHLQLVAGNIQGWGTTGELSMTRNVSAVTGACMLIKRETYEAVGGFDERLMVNYGDVDVCMAIRDKGMRIVQATDVQLTHHEMKSRGRLDTPAKEEKWKQEAAFMREKWGDKLRERYAPSYDLISSGTRIIHMK